MAGEEPKPAWAAGFPGLSPPQRVALSLRGLIMGGGGGGGIFPGSFGGCGGCCAFCWAGSRLGSSKQQMEEGAPVKLCMRGGVEG